MFLFIRDYYQSDLGVIEEELFTCFLLSQLIEESKRNKK